MPVRGLPSKGGDADVTAAGSTAPAKTQERIRRRSASAWRTWLSAVWPPPSPSPPPPSSVPWKPLQAEKDDDDMADEPVAAAASSPPCPCVYVWAGWIGGKHSLSADAAAGEAATTTAATGAGAAVALGGGGGGGDGDTVQRGGGGESTGSSSRQPRTTARTETAKGRGAEPTQRPFPPSTKGLGRINRWRGRQDVRPFAGLARGGCSWRSPRALRACAFACARRRRQRVIGEKASVGAR